MSISLAAGISIDDSGYVTCANVHCGHISCIRPEDWHGAEIRAAWRRWLGDTEDVAWMGDVKQRISFTVPDRDGSIIHFLYCQHTQKSNLGPWAAAALDETVCVGCSRPNWDRIAESRASIKFDDVLDKIKA